MTTVYVVNIGWSYEGEMTIGAFTDLEEARSFAEKRKNDADDCNIYGFEGDKEVFNESAWRKTTKRRRRK